MIEAIYGPLFVVPEKLFHKKIRVNYSRDDRKHLLAMAEAWLGLIDRAQRPVDEADARSWHPALRAKFGRAT